MKQIKKPSAGSQLSLAEVALRDLNSDRCACGAWKRPQNTFCMACYWSLSRELRLRLRQTLSQGFAEVYAEAKVFLRIETGRL